MGEIRRLKVLEPATSPGAPRGALFAVGDRFGDFYFVHSIPGNPDSEMFREWLHGKAERKKREFLVEVELGEGRVATLLPDPAFLDLYKNGVGYVIDTGALAGEFREAFTPPNFGGYFLQSKLKEINPYFNRPVAVVWPRHIQVHCSTANFPIEFHEEQLPEVLESMVSGQSREISSRASNQFETRAHLIVNPVHEKDYHQVAFRAFEERLQGKVRRMNVL